VVSLSDNYDSTAFDGSNPGAPILSLPAPPFPPAGADIFFTPRNLVTPYVGYVGSKGTKLVRLRDANQPDVNGDRPNINYGFMDQFATISASTYRALQATVRSRDWHGLSGFAGYTWSKSLDDASDGIATVALPQDSNNLRAEHGPSNFDTRHRFTAAFSYSVPRLFGPKRLSQGWQLNTIVTAQSGRPVPIVNSDDTRHRLSHAVQLSLAAQRGARSKSDQLKLEVGAGYDWLSKCQCFRGSSVGDLRRPGPE
jgi:hypothetical protein